MKKTQKNLLFKTRKVLQIKEIAENERQIEFDLSSQARYDHFETCPYCCRWYYTRNASQKQEFML